MKTLCFFCFLFGFYSFIKCNCIVHHQLGIRPNPCLNHSCKYQAWCLPNSNFTSVNCICYTSCFDVGDSTDSEPVCGTNLKQYPTVCHLRREACTLMIDIGIKYFGLCNPCTQIKCLHNKCSLDANRKPKCECSSTCKDDPKDLLCGSSGKTYDNLCLLNLDKCQNDQHIYIVNKGTCQFGG